MNRSVYPRELAVKILTQVLSKNRALDETLSEFQVGLPPAQVAWLQEVCSGTLRWKGRLDLALDSTAIHKKPSGWLRKVLLLAAYQIIVQDRVHEGLVVSETVSLVKKLEGNLPARFANACLRKISAHADAWKNLEFPTNPSNPDRNQEALWASLPVWFWSKLVTDYGLEWAKSYALASLERPEVWIRQKDPLSHPSWASEGPVQGSWKITESGSILQREGFQEGGFIVQDLSNQLMIAEVTNWIRARKGSEPFEMLDLCAAPGGKSVGMAWNGFKVTATDQNESRLGLLKETITRAAPDVKVMPWNELKGNPSSVPGSPVKWPIIWPIIWIDAPCTGSGIIRRHPDIRWLRRETDLTQLIQIQKDLLEESWKQLPPGGVLIYSVCSVFKSEGPSQIERLSFATHCEKQWIWAPHLAPHGDGFWASLFVKPSAAE